MCNRVMRAFVAVAAVVSAPAFAGDACRKSWDFPPVGDGYTIIDGERVAVPQFRWDLDEERPGGSYGRPGISYYVVGPDNFHIGGVHLGEIHAPARAVDGDTLDFSVGFRVELAGIDAPEAPQRCTDSAGETWQCGAGATRELSRLLAGNRAFEQAIERIERLDTEVAKRIMQNPEFVDYLRRSQRPAVRCSGDTCDRYGNLIAVCTLPSDGDVGEALVRAGLARDLPREAPSYADAEREARQARRGIWKGPHVAPWDWRRAR